jgi:sec-independent protein translocase protein TatA
MPDVGWPELLVILVIALVIFGPKRLPDLGKSLGKGVREFRNGLSGVHEHSDDEARQVGAPAQAATVASRGEVVTGEVVTGEVVQGETVTTAPPETRATA